MNAKIRDISIKYAVSNITNGLKAIQDIDKDERPELYSLRDLWVNDVINSMEFLKNLVEEKPCEK